MELYRLRTFVTVARYGHLTKAAEAMHVSQPTVSGQLKVLEHELGVTLFKRTARGVVLTAWGHKLLSTATAVIATLEAFATDARAHSTVSVGKLRVGTILNPEFLRLGEITSILRAQRPDIELELNQSLSDLIKQGVQKKDLDAGFFLGSIQSSTVRAIKLRAVSFCVIAPTSWKKQVDGATWHDLAKLPWVCTPKGGAYRHLSSQLFRRHKMKPSTVIETDRESTILNLVSSGVGLGLIRTDAMVPRAHRASKIFRLPGTMSTDLLFLYPSTRNDEPAVNMLINAVRAAWAPTLRRIRG